MQREPQGKAKASATLSPGYYTYPCPLQEGSDNALGGHRIQTLAGVSGICVPASQERVCAQLVVCFSVDRYIHCVDPNKRHFYSVRLHTIRCKRAVQTCSSAQELHDHSPSGALSTRVKH